ncbi:MAG: YqgE/AlgH family protein [Acetobacter orientalis]|uniref:YqgE/AlgH family protein n=1 Tax=Acetobacter orientalis TaxID=146474 RepID=UPI00209C74D9|nr:YqgE/AlgH family protein [Acetobacter orientalis]MCP1216265.1 YqgE/AlgH family protein [Acetobacter orientalis]MCP1219154.1 YqgE/AlgH family protein [Acetobacter orientalis]MCP1220553.1 YqgE/AlgH family protein [Acetobacter orientalis]
MVFLHDSLLAQQQQASDTQNSPLVGQVLVASPALAQTPFACTVIYMCAHTAQGGAMGLVVNRRLPKPSFEELLAQLDITPSPPLRRIGVSAGGPLDVTRGFVLHSSDWQGTDGLAVTPDVTLSASPLVLQKLAEGEGPHDAILAMGHASWGAGQLEEEILQQDAWLVAPALPEIVFGQDFSSKWRQALAAINLDPLQLTGQAGHA